LSDLVYLFESLPYDPVAGTTKKINFSRGLASEGDLVGATEPYPVRLSQAYTHECSIFEDNFPGDTTISVGSATVNNIDGRFDFLLDYSWDSRQVVIKRGFSDTPYASFTTEFVGSVIELTADQNSLVFTLRDNSYKLIKDFQTNKYAGSGGAEGGADLRGKTKPILLGKARNLGPIWVDSVLLTAQINDGAMASVEGIYDKANSLQFYSNYTTYAALIAANIPPGRYATSLETGFVRLGAPPVGALTVDATGMYSTAANLPEMARQMLLGKGGLVAGDLDVASFTQASLDAPQNFEGLFFAEPDFQVDTMLETIAEAINGYWYVSKTGLITLSQFKFRTPVASIRAEDLLSLGKAPSPQPLYSVKVNYAKNVTVLGPSEFTIPRQILNGYLTKEYHFVDVSGGEVPANYLGAGQFKIFLNDQQINDLEQVQFRVRDGESWITIDSLGNIAVTNSGVASATAILRANLGEFYIEEPFTLIRDSSAPLQKIVLTSDRDRFYFDDDGLPTPTVQVATLTAVGTNTTAPIVLTAVDNLGQNVPITGGNTISIASLSRSPFVSRVEVTATSANGTVQKLRLMVQQGNDAYAAGVLGALSAANEAITIYYQDDAPSSGVGIDDVWVDTDDTNKMYRWTGDAWAIISDTRIIEALEAASDAQGTANSRITSFFSTTTPTALAVGDLWYNPNTGLILRWDGDSWDNTFATRNVYRGPWTAGVAYVVGDTFTYEGSLYQTNVAHTSSAGSPPPNANVQATTATSLAELDAVASAALAGAVADIDAATDDGKITPAEKIQKLLPSHRIFVARMRSLLTSASTVALLATTNNGISVSDDLSAHPLDAAITRVLNAGTKWDGSATATSITVTGAGTASRIWKGSGNVTGTQPAFHSLKAKWVSGLPYLRLYTDQDNGVIFDVKNAQITKTYNEVLRAGMEPLGDGWYRLWYLYWPTAADSSNIAFIGISEEGTAWNYPDVGENGSFLVSDHQAGEASELRPYISGATTQAGTPIVDTMVDAYNAYLKTLETAAPDWSDPDVTSDLIPTDNLLGADSVDFNNWLVASGTGTNVRNGAWATLSDTDTTAITFLRRNYTDLASGEVYTAALKVKKDSVPKTTRFILYQTQIYGGVTGSVYGGLRIDTMTGEVTTSNPDYTTEFGSVDCGDYWYVYCSMFGYNEAGTTCRTSLFPAVGSGDLVGSDVAIIGSVDVRDAQWFKGSFSEMARRNLDEKAATFAKSMDDLAAAIRQVKVTVQWSVNGTTLWHDTFTTGDLYMRQSNDNGVTWSAAAKVVGENGSNGLNSATVFLYRRSPSAPALPTTTSTFTFATGVLTGQNNSWAQTIPGGTDPLYVTTATAVGTGTTDTIASTEWAAASILASNGTNGSAGSPGTAGLNNATVFIYQRASATPGLPGTAATYTFATGGLTGLTNGWSATVPAVNGNPLYVSVATASSTGATDSIAAAEWSSPSILAQDGATGSSGPAGAPGLNVATIYLYRRSPTTPALPTTTTTVTFSTGAATGMNNSWTQTIPGGIDPLYVTTGTASATTATDTIAAGEWATPAILAQNGAAGSAGSTGAAGSNNAIVYLYLRSATVPSGPTATTTFTFATSTLSGTPGNGWATTIPAGTDPLYVIAATASSNTATDTIASGEWSSPIILASNGDKRQTVFIRSYLAPTAPTGNGPIPSGGWSDGPTGTFTDGYLWMSTATLNASNELVGTWSIPVQVIIPGTSNFILIHKDPTTSFSPAPGQLVKSGASSWFNSGAYSTQGYTGGCSCSFKADYNNEYFMAGLTRTTGVLNFTSIDYAMAPVSDGTLRIYEGGSAKFTNRPYAAGDRFAIALVDGTVKYYHNGVLIYTSLVLPSMGSAYYFDCELNTDGASLSELSFIGSGAVGLRPDVKFLRASAMPTFVDASAPQPQSVVGGVTVDWLDGVPAGTGTLWITRANKNGAGNLVTGTTWEDPQALSAMEFRGPWVTATAYIVNQSVSYNGGTYICVQDHTSSATIKPSGTGQGNSYWDVIAAPAPPPVGGAFGSSGTPTVVNVPASTVGQNLRSLADAAGYTGGDCWIDFVTTGAVTGAPNSGAGINTGTWPTTGTVSLKLTANHIVRGGGGSGGAGGKAGGSAGSAGGAGLFQQISFLRGIVIGASGGFQGGAGGGGGGSGIDNSTPGEPGNFIRGGGGGGGAPFGVGGGGNPAGATATTTAGGAGGTGGGASNGGAGGNCASLTAPTAGTAAGGAGGAAGNAIKRNGFTGTLSGSTTRVYGANS
jgi:hypothetical protein